MLVFAVECDKVGMEETLLWELILVADSVQIETGAEVLFLVDEGVDVFDVFFLEEDSGFGGRVLVLAVGDEGFWRVWKWFALFAAVH